MNSKNNPLAQMLNLKPQEKKLGDENAESQLVFFKNKKLVKNSSQCDALKNESQNQRDSLPSSEITDYSKELSKKEKMERTLKLFDGMERQIIEKKKRNREKKMPLQELTSNSDKRRDVEIKNNKTKIEQLAKKIPKEETRVLMGNLEKRRLDSDEKSDSGVDSIDYSEDSLEENEYGSKPRKIKKLSPPIAKKRIEADHRAHNEDKKNENELPKKNFKITPTIQIPAASLPFKEVNIKKVQQVAIPIEAHSQESSAEKKITKKGSKQTFLEEQNYALKKLMRSFGIVDSESESD